MSDNTQTKETNSRDVDLITELFEDLISDIVDLNPYPSNVFLLRYLDMKPSLDNKQPIDTIRMLPRKSVSAEKVKIEPVNDTLCKSNSWSSLTCNNCNPLLQRFVYDSTSSIKQTNDQQLNTKSEKYDSSRSLLSSSLSSLSPGSSIRASNGFIKNDDGMFDGSGGYFVDQKAKFSSLNLEKIEEYPEIEFESKTKTFKNLEISSNTNAIQRLENSRKNIGDVIDPKKKCTTVCSIDANNLSKTKYHTILNIAPKEISKNSSKYSKNNDSNAMTDILKNNAEKNGGYQCFQVISSAVVKSSKTGNKNQSKPFISKEINTTKVVYKKQDQNIDCQTQVSKLKMNTLNNFELSERIKHLAGRINLNRLNKRMKIEKNVVDNLKQRPKNKTSSTMPPVVTNKQNTTKITQPKLQVSAVGRAISPNWITKRNREKQIQAKDKKVNLSTQRFNDKQKRKREVDFVAKQIVIQPASKSNFNDTKTCHLKLVLTEMDKDKADTKQFINNTVAEQLRNIFKNIKEKKTSPKILVKPPKISNVYVKEKLMNSIPGILNDIIQRSSSTSITKCNIEIPNQTSKKNYKPKIRSRKNDMPLQAKVLKHIRTLNEIGHKNEHKQLENKYLSSETKLLNSIKPEDILPISAEYSKQKKLKSVNKSMENLQSIEANGMNLTLKNNHKMYDEMVTSTNDRKIHKHKISILKFNDILKLKQLSNTLTSYFRRSNRSFETIIPLTVQSLYNKGKVLTNHQYSLWKQYNSKSCIVSNKTGDNHAFVRPYTPLIELPLKSAQKLASASFTMQQQSNYNNRLRDVPQDRFRTIKISSQDSDISDNVAKGAQSNTSTRSNNTSLYSDRSLLSSHHTLEKDKEENVLKVINAEMDDVSLKNDPTLGGILGLSVHNLKNNDIRYVKSINEKESSDWLYRQYLSMNGDKAYTIPMIRRFYDPKNVHRSPSVEDYLDLQSTLVC